MVVSGFVVSGCGLRVFRFGFFGVQVQERLSLGLGSRVSRFQVSGFGLMVSGFGLRVSGVWVSGVWVLCVPRIEGWAKYAMIPVLV